jgi:hypothetical protein
MMQITGKTRWRSQRRRFSGREELVLQLQWSGTVMEWNGYFADSDDRTEWRDARSEDMATVGFPAPQQAGDGK